MQVVGGSGGKVVLVEGYHSAFVLVGVGGGCLRRDTVIRANRGNNGGK